MKNVKIGVIGCGGIANGKHLPAYSANKDAELYAFCDIVIERAEKAKEKYGNENSKVYADYKELLKKVLMQSSSLPTTASTAELR